MGIVIFSLQGEDGGSMGGGGSYEFGLDPNDDPKLALANRYLKGQSHQMLNRYLEGQSHRWQTGT